ncbi:MAG TPA: universal stress protein, partial [Vicinamibacteria bacterium]|nr:universal stress protein [Vicinamibacteria bacterium]
PELPSLIGKRLSELYEGPSEIVVTEGSVVEEILETAKSRKVSLVIMGTRGLQGSVTERVLGRAKVPVLAVK